MKLFIISCLLFASALAQTAAAAGPDVSTAKAELAQATSKSDEALKSVRDAQNKLKEAAENFIGGETAKTEAMDKKDEVAEKAAEAKAEELAKKVEEAAEAKEDAEKAAAEAAQKKEDELKAAQQELTEA